MYRAVSCVTVLFTMSALTNGITNGAVLALTGLAFQTVYLPTGIFHLGLGVAWVVAPLVAWCGIRVGLPLPLVAGLGVLAGSIVSLLFELVNHRPLVAKGAPLPVHLVSSLGLYLVGTQLLSLLAGSETKVLRPGVDRAWHIGTAIISRAQLIAAASACVVLLGFVILLMTSGLGRALRALADNPTELALRGHNVSCLRSVSFGLSGAMMSVAGLATAYDVGFDTHGGLTAVLLAVVAVILGGRDSFLRTACAGLLLAVGREYIASIWSARWLDAATFGFLALVLVIRPSGAAARSLRRDAST